MIAGVYTNAFRYYRVRSRRFSGYWKAAAIWYCAIALGAAFSLNWIYQVGQKPGEILAPLSTVFSKSPESTWQTYRSLFENHSTSIVSPELLAALAQIESSGNPLALTQWRWRWSWNPLEIYRPASSALGMYQITDGTFAEARRYCIRNHQVVSDGAWPDLGSCWFNSFYIRTSPSHASEMTAAHLHRGVVSILAARRITKATLAQKQRLAAVIHLCGKQRGESFVRRNFRASSSERCGKHSLGRYLSTVDLLKERFARLRMISSSE